MNQEAPNTRWVFLFHLGLSVAFCAPLFVSPDALGQRDWDQHFFYYGSVIKSVVEFGQPPYWNPWYCGGNVLWQNPQVPLLSPVFLIATVVSLPLAMKLNIVLHCFLGLVGTHLLVTSLGVSSRAVAIYLAVMATCSGALALHLSVGHSVFLPCFLLPLQLHCCIRAVVTSAPRYVAAGGALLALTIYAGSLHVVPMSLAALGLFCVFAAATRRRWAPLIILCGTVVVGFALAAPKLLPVVLWVSSDEFVDARSVVPRPDYMTGEMIVHAFLDRDQDRVLQFRGQRGPWHEYGNYIGVIGVIATLTSMVLVLVVRGASERWLGASLGLTSIALLVLSAGEFSGWAPATIAGSLPFFSSFRLPSRYTVVFVVVAVATIAWTIRAIDASGLLGLRGKHVLAALSILAALDLVMVNRRHFDRVFSGEPFVGEFSAANRVDHLQIDAITDPYASASPAFQSLMNSRSLYNCYESLQTRRVATPDLPLIRSDGNSEISEIRFSPNQVDFSATVGPEPSEVSLNQNLTEGWRSTSPPVQPSRKNGQPSVVLPEHSSGRHSFRFEPPGLQAGSAVCVLALAVVAAARRRGPW